jgi:hypothetical protein
MRVLLVVMALVIGLAGAAQAEPNPLAVSAIGALNDLDSAVSAGVNFLDYSKRLPDTNVVVNRFIRTCPPIGSILRPIRDSNGDLTYDAAGHVVMEGQASNATCDWVRDAMQSYVKAGAVWNRSIQSGSDYVDPSFNTSDYTGGRIWGLVPVTAYIAQLWKDASGATKMAGLANH